MAGAGLIFGVAAKLFDLYTPTLGDIFSQMSVWIFLGTVITVFSSTPWRAGANVFFFCVAMLFAYYLTAELMSSAYSMTLVCGWTVFAFFSPVLAFCTWYAKGKGILSKVIGVGIIFVMLIAAVVLFDKIRPADLLFAILTGIVLFTRRRPKSASANKKTDG